MAGVVTQDFRLYNAQNLYNDVVNGTDLVYLFIGQAIPWGDDNNPPAPFDAVEPAEYRPWNYMLAMKRISSASVSHGIINNAWVTGAVYTQYSSNANYTDTSNYNFYVVTDDFNVYKCLYNNNGGQSTVNPSGTLTTSFLTSDGYQWKYMYSIDSGGALKWLTPQFAPIQTLVSNDGSNQWATQQAAVNGSIETTLVLTGGTGYSENAGTLVSATSSSAVLGITASSTNGLYTNCSIYLTGGTGAGQLRKIIQYVGSTRTIAINSNWSVTPDASSTYIVSPTVTFAGDGSGATAYSTVSGSAVNRIYMITIGSNFTYATATISANTSATGATAKPEIAPPGGHGSDAVRELCGHNILWNCQLVGSESNTITTQNSWRQVGLLINPVFTANSSIATGTEYDMTTKLNITSVTGSFTKDEKIVGGSSGAYCYLVETTSSSILSVAGVFGTFTNSETISGQSSGATATLSSTTLPLIKKYKGHILYIQDNSPIARGPDQTEDFKICLRY